MLVRGLLAYFRLFILILYTHTQLIDYVNTMYMFTKRTFLILYIQSFKH